jgi:hypothetical protein
MQSIVIVRVKKQGIKHNWVANSDGLYECPYCDKKGKRTTISEHVSQKHVEETGRQELPFQCDHCDKKYQASTHLRNHIRDFHKNVRVQCPECDYSAKNKYALYSHYSVKHMSICTETTPSGEEKCTCCSKIMSKMASKYHVATCFVESPFYNGSF